MLLFQNIAVLMIFYASDASQDGCSFNDKRTCNTPIEDLHKDAHCNIRRVEELSEENFNKYFKDQKPVIVRHLTRNENFAKQASLEVLLENYGNEEVILSTANTYSYDKVSMSVREYIEKFVQKSEGSHRVYDSENGVERLYLFGDNYQPWLEKFLSMYDQVPYGDSADQALSFGLGGDLSGRKCSMFLFSLPLCSLTRDF